MTRGRHLSFAVVLVLNLTTVLSFLAMYGPAEAQTNTRYVAKSGMDAGDCLDPGNPCQTVQYAVDVSVSGDVIKVAAGKYTEMHSRPSLPGDPYPPPGGVVYQIVSISHPLTIQGGYLATNFNEPPDPSANPTILDAVGEGRVFYVVGEITTTLEGLVATGGQVGDPEVVPGYGGGLYVISATVTISDCIIQDSEAVPLYEDYWGDWRPMEGGQGGGIYAYGGHVSILCSRVEDNSAWFGAGLYLHGGRLTAIGSDVLGNSARAMEDLGTSGNGGGLYLTGANALLVGGAVTGNRSEGTGGGLCLVGSAATLDGVTIVGNEARGSWGGYGYGSGGGLSIESSEVILTGNTVSGNHAAWYGGGLHLTRSEVAIEQTRVTDNSVEGGRFGLWGGGSGLYLSDSHATLSQDVVQRNQSDIVPCGSLCLVQSELRAENTLIADNVVSWDSSAQGSGAVDLNGSTATLVHVTLARNTGWRGGGLHVSDGSAVTMTNTILVSHTVGVGVSAGGTANLEATAWGTGPWANGVDWTSAGTVVTGTVNLWGDPAFVDPAAGDYHIGPTSIARDHGIPAGTGHDIDAEPRPDGCFYDIGADEVLTGRPCWRLYLPIVVRSAE